MVCYSQTTPRGLSVDLMKPTVDLAFHRLFSHHGNASVLLDFLNALLLSSGDRPATTVKVLSPILERRSADSKGGVLEIRASLEDGRRANVEMQVVNQRDWRVRSLYYWAGIHGTQLKPSEPYEKTTPTISVGVAELPAVDRERVSRNVSSTGGPRPRLGVERPVGPAYGGVAQTATDGRVERYRLGPLDDILDGRAGITEGGGRDGVTSHSASVRDPAGVVVRPTASHGV